MFTLSRTFSLRSFAILAGAILMTQTTQSQGQVTFTSALRNVGVAAPNNGVPNTEIQSTALGDFDETLLRMPISDTGQIGRLLASQQSRILSDRVEFALTADTSQSNPNYIVPSLSLSALASFGCTFTINEPTEYLLMVTALSDTSFGGQHAITLTLRNVPPFGTELIFQISSVPAVPMRGLLQPGDYSISGIAAAGSRAIGFNGIVGIAQSVATFVIPAPMAGVLLPIMGTLSVGFGRRRGTT